MAPRATGRIAEDLRKDGQVYRSLRFRAGGQRHFEALGPVSRADAERALRGILADVERGVWKPRVAPPPVPEPDRAIPSFHEYAESWWLRNQGHWRETGRADYKWRLERHLLPFFAEIPLDRITYGVVEDYVAAKLSEKHPLSARSINMTTTLLGQIMESAVEAELIGRNPARGKRRRVREATPRRTFLDTAEGISALIEAAGRVDDGARARVGQRRALISTLVFAGLRIGEALSLRWRDVDLARGTLTVRAAKTDAGVRTVNLLPVLRDELLSYRARTIAAPDVLVFGTSTNREQHRSHIRSRMLAKAIEGANETLAKAGRDPLPTGLTPHSLRRTFASILFAIGEPPPYVMAQMGHTTPDLTLAIYARQMDRRDGEPERLRALVEGADWALTGTRGSETTPTTSGGLGPSTRKAPR